MGYVAVMKITAVPPCISFHPSIKLGPKKTGRSDPLVRISTFLAAL